MLGILFAHLHRYRYSNQFIAQQTAPPDHPDQIYLVACDYEPGVELQGASTQDGVLFVDTDPEGNIIVLRQSEDGCGQEERGGLVVDLGLEERKLNTYLRDTSVVPPGHGSSGLYRLLDGPVVADVLGTGNISHTLHTIRDTPYSYNSPVNGTIVTVDIGGMVDEATSVSTRQNPADEDHFLIISDEENEVVLYLKPLSGGEDPLQFWQPVPTAQNALQVLAIQKGMSVDQAPEILESKVLQVEQAHTSEGTETVVYYYARVQEENFSVLFEKHLVVKYSQTVDSSGAVILESAIEEEIDEGKMGGEGSNNLQVIQRNHDESSVVAFHLPSGGDIETRLATLSHSRTLTESVVIDSRQINPPNVYMIPEDGYDPDNTSYILYNTGIQTPTVTLQIIQSGEQTDISLNTPEFFEVTSVTGRYAEEGELYKGHPVIMTIEMIGTDSERNTITQQVKIVTAGEGNILYLPLIVEDGPNQ